MKVGTNWVMFYASHRLSWHPKCQRMHGHGFRIRAEIEGTVDAKRGIVVDFGEVHKSLKAIADKLDHRFLAASKARWVVVPDESSGMLVRLKKGNYYSIDDEYFLPERDVVVMPMEEVSTENLAQWLLGELVKEPWAQGVIVTAQVSENGENIAEAKQAVFTGLVGWNLSTTYNPDWNYWPSDNAVPWVSSGQHQ